MKKLFLISAIFSVLTISAQNKWYDDFAAAKLECKNSGKLMVIDFWAEWCKPCKVMDEKLWNNPDVKIQYQNFVGAKINVDVDKTTPEKFAVTGIPKVVVTLPDGEVLWEKSGFYVAEEYVDALNSIPEDVSKLYRFYLGLCKLTKDSECSFNIAWQFQQMAGQTSNAELRDAFIRQDEKYFKKAIKDNTDTNVTSDIEVYLLLNDVYKGKAAKALKKFNNTIGGAEKCKNKELAHFFLANCYRALNDIETFNKELSMLSSDDFINQLK